MENKPNLDAASNLAIKKYEFRCEEINIIPSKGFQFVSIMLTLDYGHEIALR